MRDVPLRSVGYPVAVNVPCALTTIEPSSSVMPVHENVPSNVDGSAVVTITWHLPSSDANDVASDPEPMENSSRRVADVGWLPRNDVPLSANAAVSVSHPSANGPGGGA